MQENQSRAFSRFEPFRLETFFFAGLFISVRLIRKFINTGEANLTAQYLLSLFSSLIFHARTVSNLPGPSSSNPANPHSSKSPCQYCYSQRHLVPRITFQTTKSNLRPLLGSPQRTYLRQIHWIPCWAINENGGARVFIFIYCEGVRVDRGDESHSSDKTIPLPHPWQHLPPSLMVS